MNFEDCKKVFTEYLIGELSQIELMAWASKHCEYCKEKVCHCIECPLFINRECKFPN